MNVQIARFAPGLLSTNLRPCARVPRACIVSKWLTSRGLNTATAPESTPLRKHLKDEAKRKKAEARSSGSKRQGRSDSRLDTWELTVGIEVHAELNTACKLFSNAEAASAESDGLPNTKVAPFDAALPGAQPQFQLATLLPALRAAIVLGCEVQKKSSWDRKHYFHWDQPNGYQITQYYEPFAKDGTIDVGAEDGVPVAELQGAAQTTVGIKQIQMEQDTAKTINVGSLTHHIDLNRAGHPLIEIITLPHIHSPQTAAAVVRKLQALLKSVDACVTGMELGGLRADVNVSVRQRGTEGASSCSGVSGLGQRTEIKNLSSFAAIEQAIVAERDRQIGVLESGGIIEGETRGWALGATETTRLRGKEGEVDYRYMPDADLPPLLVSSDLVEHLQNTLPALPNETIERVQREYGLSLKDAKTIVGLDDGDRLEFIGETVDLATSKLNLNSADKAKIGRIAGNWVLHELGGLLTSTNAEWTDLTVAPEELADLLVNLQRKQITARAAKQILSTLHGILAHGPSTNAQARPTVEVLIEEGNLRLRPLSEQGYMQLAEQIVADSPAMVAAVRDRGQTGKLMWFVGQMVRKGEEGTVEPETAREVVEKLLMK